MWPARFFLLFLSASCAASASEVATCDPASDASCVNGGQDYQSMLQARVGVDTHETKTDEETDEEKSEAILLEMQASSSSSWTACAQERRRSGWGKVCHCNGRVKYGSNSRRRRGGGWNYKDVSGSIDCSNGQFGDPTKGTTKYCYCQAQAQTSNGVPPPTFTMTSKYKCSKSDYGSHFWLYRDDVAKAFSMSTDYWVNRNKMVGKQFWVSKADGTNVRGPYTIDDFNNNDNVDPASGRPTAYVSTASNPSSGLNREQFKHKHYVGDKLYFQNPGSSSTQSYCSNVDEICRCLERNSYCKKVFNYDCHDYKKNIQECDKAADKCWSSATAGCKQQCVNAQWSYRDRYAKGCGCTDKHYWDFYGLLEEGEGSQDARSNAFGNSSNEISGEMQTSSLDDSITGKRTCR